MSKKLELLQDIGLLFLRYFLSSLFGLLLLFSVTGLAQDKTLVSSPAPKQDNVVLSPTPIPTTIPITNLAQSSNTGVPVISGTPVVINNKILFRIKEKSGSFTPVERAEVVTKRVQSIAFNPFVTDAKVAIEDFEDYTDIKVDDIVILTLTKADALAEGKTRQELAKEVASALQDALTELKANYNNKNILIGFLLTLLATGGLIVFLRLEKFFFNKLEEKIELPKATLLKPVKVQNVELVSVEKLKSSLLIAVQLIRTALVIVALIFYLPLIFSFFPWTRGLSVTFFNFILNLFSKLWQNIAEYLPNLFILIVVLIVTFYSVRLARFIFRELAKGTLKINGFEREWAKPTYKIISFLMLCCGVAIAFPYLPGAGSPAFQGVSIFLGVLFSLASSSAISNIIAGVILTYTKAFRLGDRVKIADTTGDVVEKTLLVTRLRTIRKVEIAIPNSVVLNSYVINYSTSANKEGVVLNTSVTIGYDAAWRKVHELLLSAAEITPGILKNPAPFVLQTALNDFYVSYEINAYTEKANEMEFIYSSLHQNIQDRFNDAGVEIMSPHYSSLRDGNTIAIPEKYRGEGYRPNHFKIQDKD